MKPPARGEPKTLWDAAVAVHPTTAPLLLLRLTSCLTHDRHSGIQRTLLTHVYALTHYERGAGVLTTPLEPPPRRHDTRHTLVEKAPSATSPNFYTNTGRSSTLANMHVEGCMTVIWLRLPHDKQPMPRPGHWTADNRSRSLSDDSSSTVERATFRGIVISSAIKPTACKFRGNFCL